MKISQVISVTLTPEDVQKACAMFIASNGLMVPDPTRIVVGSNGATVTIQEAQTTEPLEVKFEGGITPIEVEATTKPKKSKTLLPDPVVVDEDDDEVSEVSEQAVEDTPPFDADTMKKSPLFA